MGRINSPAELEKVRRELLKKRDPDKHGRDGHDPIRQEVRDGKSQDDQKKDRRGDDSENRNDNEIGHEGDEGEPVEIKKNQGERSERRAQGDEKKDQGAAACLF